MRTIKLANGHTVKVDAPKGEDLTSFGEEIKPVSLSKKEKWLVSALSMTGLIVLLLIVGIFVLNQSWSSDYDRIKDRVSDTSDLEWYEENYPQLQSQNEDLQSDLDWAKKELEDYQNAYSNLSQENEDLQVQVSELYEDVELQTETNKDIYYALYDVAEAGKIDKEFLKFLAETASTAYDSSYNVQNDLYYLIENFDN